MQPLHLDAHTPSHQDILWRSDMLIVLIGIILKQKLPNVQKFRENTSDLLGKSTPFIHLQIT